MPPLINLAGQRFGRWTVLRRQDGPKLGASWLCRCDCGNEAVVYGQPLREGQSQSCGCLNVDVHREMCIARNTTHGRSRQPEHTVWSNMKQRCTNPRASGFH